MATTVSDKWLTSSKDVGFRYSMSPLLCSSFTLKVQDGVASSTAKASVA